jgi:hypothetical protein
VHADCRLLLQGNSDINISSTNRSSSVNNSSSTGRVGVAVASLSCNSSDGTPVPIAINETHLQQHAAAFAGVKILAASECKADAATATPAPIHGLLYFCSSSHHLVLLRPVIRNLALPLALPGDISSTASSNHSWHQAILAFGGNVTASIVNGSFTDNIAGTAVLARQQAVLSVTNSSFQRNNSTFGGELLAHYSSGEFGVGLVLCISFMPCLQSASTFNKPDNNQICVTVSLCVLLQ